VKFRTFIHGTWPPAMSWMPWRYLEVISRCKVGDFVATMTLPLPARASWYEAKARGVCAQDHARGSRLGVSQSKLLGVPGRALGADGAWLDCPSCIAGVTTSSLRIEPSVKGRRIFPSRGHSNFPTRLRCVVVV
jgi:hypothetical protein